VLGALEVSAAGAGAAEFDLAAAADFPPTLKRFVNVFVAAAAESNEKAELALTGATDADGASTPPPLFVSTFELVGEKSSSSSKFLLDFDLLDAGGNGDPEDPVKKAFILISSEGAEVLARGEATLGSHPAKRTCASFTACGKIDLYIAMVTCAGRHSIP